jgi:hypothetical protein
MDTKSRGENQSNIDASATASFKLVVNGDLSLPPPPSEVFNYGGPFTPGNPGIIPREEFVVHNHDCRGKSNYDPTDRAYRHLGIFVVGSEEDQKPRFTRVE